MGEGLLAQEQPGSWGVVRRGWGQPGQARRGPGCTARCPSHPWLGSAAAASAAVWLQPQVDPLWGAWLASWAALLGGHWRLGLGPGLGLGFGLSPQVQNLVQVLFNSREAEGEVLGQSLLQYEQGSPATAGPCRALSPPPPATYPPRQPGPPACPIPGEERNGRPLLPCSPAAWNKESWPLSILCRMASQGTPTLDEPASSGDFSFSPSRS